MIKSDDAVSPVIAVILLVAVTVTLSAVIGGFALNLGQSSTDSSGKASVSTNSYVDNGTQYVEMQLITQTSGKAVSYSVNGTEGNLSSVGDVVTLKEGTDFYQGDTISIIVEGTVVQSIDTDDLSYSSVSTSDVITTETVLFEGFEDGDASEYTLNGDSDGTGYYFNSSTDAKTGTYGFNHRLKGSGGAGIYVQTNSTSIDVSPSNTTKISSWFKVFEVQDGNPDYPANAELYVNVTTEGGVTDTIRYRLATIASTPNESASNLFFVVDNHSTSTTTWLKMSRNINDDLAAGGYTNVTQINSISFRIVTPGTGGGTDIIGTRHDDVNITETG